MPPAHDGNVWYRETIQLLEQRFAGNRVDFLADTIRKQVVKDHKRLGFKHRPRVSPEMVIRAAVTYNVVSEAEAHQYLRWHKQEQAKLQAKANIPAELRSEVFERDRGVCQYCGERGTTLDHVLPVSKGGKANRFNLLVACHACNSKKSAKVLPEETVKVIHFFLKRERTVANGYPYMSELVRQFFEQLEQKPPFQQARIRGVVGIRKVLKR